VVLGRTDCNIDINEYRSYQQGLIASLREVQDRNRSGYRLVGGFLLRQGALHYRNRLDVPLQGWGPSNRSGIKVARIATGYIGSPIEARTGCWPSITD